MNEDSNQKEKVRNVLINTFKNVKYIVWANR